MNCCTSTESAKRKNLTETSDIASTEATWLTEFSLRKSVSHRLQMVRNGARTRQDAVSLRKKREQEFAAGRACAHQLLFHAGCNESVGVNPDRSPNWPIAFVGSISHSEHWTWAAVAPRSALNAIGIDTEPVVNTKTRMELESEIATTHEWRLAQTLELDREQIFSLVFSAKESFYKCWYPINGKYFGFDQVVVESVTPESVRICNHSSNPNYERKPNSLDVRFLVDDTDVFTITWMEQEA